ncbi:MAG TPA: phasin family protein [Arenibaculum sp.]|nr:phasin family protein [Arenibaculum sp.]
MAKSTPFFDFDMTRMMDVSKLLGDFKLPGVDVEQVMTSQRKNIEALTAANQLALEGYQAILRRQGEILRQAIEQTNTMISELMAVGTPEEKVARNADMVKVAFEKTLANTRELAEMAAKSNGEAADVLNRRVSEGLEELKGVIQKARK